jgi:hypothetical protein
MTTVIQAIANAANSDHPFQLAMRDHLPKLLPSGSGFDAGCTIDWEKSGKDSVIVQFSYHRLNENGYYDGWIDCCAGIKPDFWGISVELYCPDEDLADYIHDTLAQSLTELVPDSVYLAVKNEVAP